MPTYLYKIQPTRADMLSAGPNEIEAAVLAQHFEYLELLTQSGQVQLVGRTLTEDSNAFGIVIFKADSEEKAISLAEADPAISRGVMSFELFPFRVALWSDSQLQD